MSVAPVSPGSAGLAGASPQQKKTMLRRAVQEMVGTTFYGQMLKIARSSPLKGKYGHGGRGEEIFGNQLDAELARRAGEGTRNSLTEAIYERLARHMG